MTEKAARVLSIQSHVVHGYVGNKSATFPLQVLGIEVDAINSVQFSNHTGYQHMKGEVMKEKELCDLMEGLSLNGINKYSHLLTGYVGNPDFLKRIAEIVKDLRQVNPGLVYVCDPVMGDNGRMYVPESLLPVYRDVIIPLADIVTPNQYEVELLTGSPIVGLEQAWTSLQWFHNRGVATVVLSSSDLGDHNTLVALASQIKDGKRTRISLNIPRQRGSFTGTGDLFAALFLAHFHRSDGNIVNSMENTIASLQAVLTNTLNGYREQESGIVHMKDLELKLIQSKKDIEYPSPVISAQIVE